MPHLEKVTELLDAGDVDAALDVAEHGLGLEYKIGKRELAHWTRDQARTAGKYELALHAARVFLIYLHENMLAEAMEALEKPEFAPDHDLHRVIGATKGIYPDWGIRICRQKAEGIINAGNAGIYERAVSWLRIARDIYQEEQRLEEWEAYLDSLLESHHRKYKLVPMLQNIR